MVSLNQIERGAARYVDNEILPKINKGGLAKVAIGTAAGVLGQRMGRLIEKYTNNQMLAALGIVDAEHNVDLDLLIPEIKKSFPDEGVRVAVPNPLTGAELVAMTFHREDIDRLHQYIMQG